MRCLSARDEIRLLDFERDPSSADKAAILLGAACPDMAGADLASLPIGKRDELLLRLREAMFGPVLAARTRCPHCAEDVDLQLDVAALLDHEAPEQPDEHGETFTVGGFSFRFRAPCSTDLRDAHGCENLDAARELLVNRCILSVRRGEDVIPVSDVPQDTLAALSERIDRSHRLLELRIGITCPCCEHRWEECLDPASFLWEELRAKAVHILQEVDALARAYGWREEDVLAMSASRRRLYVDMVQR